jgi:hypothetical protein
MKNLSVTESNLITNKVDIQLNVLGAAMMNRVGGEVGSVNVVAEDDGDLVNRKGKLREELAKPNALSNWTKPSALSNCVGDGTILSLSTRPRDSGLSFG